MGIIGFGNMGKAHTNKITSGMVPNMEICALCDIDEKKRDLIKEMYPDIPVFADAEEMFKSGLIDSVTIAIPHYDHAKYAIMAFDYGLNVLTEKPAGVYTKQVKEMNEAAAKSDKVFGIMYNQRTNPLYQKLKNLIEDGELGGIKRITWIITDWYRTQAYHDSSAWRSNWKLEGGGALINQAVHSLDLLRYLADDFVSVRANMMNYSLEDVIEVEDTFVARIGYKNCAKAFFIATNAYPVNSPYDIEITFAKGVARYTNDCLTVNGEVVARDEIATGPKAYWGRSHTKLLVNFCDKGEYFNIEDAENTMYTMYSMYDSAKNGGKEIDI